MSYSTGTVYKIICRTNSDIVYIGSTFNSLRNRWQHHKQDFRKYLEGKSSCVAIYPYFEKHGIENFKIIKVKEYECYRTNRADYKHLQAYEQLWINKTKNCVNKQNPFCIKKLSNKQYREEHKEEINKQRKQYREDNKEQLKVAKKQFYDKNRHKILEQKKQYQIDNKEQISQRRKEPKLCIVCKSTVRKNDFKQHTRTKKHLQNAQQIIYNFLSKYRK